MKASMLEKKEKRHKKDDKTKRRLALLAFEGLRKNFCFHFVTLCCGFTVCCVLASLLDFPEVGGYKVTKELVGFCRGFLAV